MKLPAACLLVVSLVMVMTCAEREPVPPAARVAPHELEAHGDVRVDDYYWLRERSNPDVIAYLEAENAYADEVLAPTGALREVLADEIRNRIPQTDSTVPAPDHGSRYYHRTVDGRAYPIYCRVKDDPGAREEVLLDVNRVAEGHEFCSAGRIRVSPTTDIMVWAVDTVGRRKYTLRFEDLATGRVLTDEIPDVTGETEWFNDGRNLLYSRQDPDTLRSYQVWRHTVGADPADDVLVFQEDDETFNVSLSRTRSGRFLLISSNQSVTSEVRFMDADDPVGEPVVIEPRRRGVEYSVAHQGDRWLILTNLGATNFRLVEAAIEAPGRSDWSEVVPHREDVLLEGVEAFADFLVLEERSNGLGRLVVTKPNAGRREEISFDESASVVRTGDNREYDTGTFRFTYSSLATPESVYELDVATGERRLLKQAEVRGGYDPSHYVSERLWATARDGARIPISVLRPRDFIPDKTAPLLLYGYGSYGHTLEPSFNPTVLSLANRGFSYAIAHVRGGQALGRQWYEDGKLLNKMNTFTDFIDCARHLVDAGYTSPDRLVARGGSAGGLLMGAVVNLAPELFAGVVAHVPFVDVVTTMLDESIPLTTGEYDEWGNPNDPEFYDVMLAYSPYDRVKAGRYPPMLVTAGLHDSQVQYWEPAKWVAKLRALKTDDHPLLLRTRMDAGHGGASDRYDSYRETAEEYAFMLMVVGAV